MQIPDNLLYTKDHEWIRVEGDHAYVGITNFAQSELGDIVYVDITSVGKTVAEHDVFGTIEAVKTTSDLFMPVTGKVLEMNPDLDASPDLVNNDPYGQGWLIKVALEGKTEGLMTAEQYAALTGK